MPKHSIHPFDTHPAYSAPMSVRDVALLDLARHLFRDHRVPLLHMPDETHALFLALRGWADRRGEVESRDEFLNAAEAEGARLASAVAARYAATSDA